MIRQVELDTELLHLFLDRSGRDRFMVFHPSWGCFVQFYGMKQVPIEVEGKAPRPARLRGLIEETRQQRIRVIFGQPRFSPESAEIVAREIGGRVAVADPLAADWARSLRNRAEAFRSAVDE